MKNQIDTDLIYIRDVAWLINKVIKPEYMYGSKTLGWSTYIINGLTIDRCFTRGMSTSSRYFPESTVLEISHDDFLISYHETKDTRYQNLIQYENRRLFSNNSDKIEDFDEITIYTVGDMEAFTAELVAIKLTISE